MTAAALPPAPEPIKAFTIIVDAREQMPWKFSDRVTTATAKLPAGDYSVAGLETRVAIERKSRDDLVRSLTAERDRFFEELKILYDYQWSAIVVESGLLPILQGDYSSQASPASVVGSLAAIAVSWRTQVFFADSRAGAALLSESLLTKAAAKWWHIRAQNYP